jgi:hypothetical protein
MRWVGHAARTRERKNAYMVLWGNLKETESLEARIRWDENIKTNIKNTMGGFGLD